MSLKKIFQTVYNFIVRYPLAIVASIFILKGNERKQACVISYMHKYSIRCSIPK